MNINNLTIGQLKELSSLFNLQSQQSSTSPTQSPISEMLNNAVGKYVIIRSRNEGINAGILKAADSSGCILSGARRIWYHKPKDNKISWYEGVAESGLSGDSKISCAVSEKYIMEDYSITVCSDVAMVSIAGMKSYEPNK